METLLVLILVGAAALGAGLAVGYGLKRAHVERIEEAARLAAKAAAEAQAQAIRQTAQEQARVIVEKAEVATKAELIERRRELEAEFKREREELKRQEDRLTRRSDQLDSRAEKLDREEERLSREIEKYQGLQREADEFRLAAEAAKAEARRQLEEISGLTPERARELILDRLDAELEQEKATRIRAAVESATLEAKRKAAAVICQAIQRSASEVTANVTVSVVTLPNDSMKGRIIGREGRNVRAFEALTGVDVIIDDTPEAVILSSFNPIRREVAKRALQELVADGRIHPARIEEVIDRAQAEMKRLILEKGEEAAAEVGVVGLKPGLLQLLGRMHFRTSYGQNILEHSVQVAHLSGIIAAELGADHVMAKRAGLLHDIGKSIDREIEGTHVEIGVSLGKRFGEPFEVLDAIGYHHDVEHAETLYTPIVEAADAISAARPGARREALETYIKRLEQLESIASSFPGVEKSYAIQAGREVRIIVKPEQITDAKAVLLAREIAGRIERDMEYPGQVQVTVVRESRAVEYAR